MIAMYPPSLTPSLLHSSFLALLTFPSLPHSFPPSLGSPSPPSLPPSCLPALAHVGLISYDSSLSSSVTSLERQKVKFNK